MTEVLITKIVVGIICGIWPLLVGFKSRQPLLGVVGFLLALGGGLITGFLLAAPVAYGSGWFIERRGRKLAGTETTPPETPEDSTESTE